MNERDEYLAFWRIPDGEAEGAWQAKLALDRGEFRGCAPMAIVQRDVCYDSPIDGTPITTKHKRAEDLARAGCVEYDPEMKTDYERRKVESQTALERDMRSTIEREISTMPAAKLERLSNELASGADATVVRQAPTP